MMLSAHQDELVLAISEAIFARVRAIHLAAQRLDRLPENEPGTSRLGSQDVPKLVEEFLFRLAMVGLEPHNLRMLKEIVQHNSLPLARLVESSGLPALAVTERIADMVQVGLVERSLVGNYVQASRVARLLVDLVDAVSRQLATKTYLLNASVGLEE